MVQTLRDFVKSIKAGDWDLHVCFTDVSRFHAYNNYNYACHFSYYWASQQALAQDHPGIFQHFKEGGVSVRRTAGKFNKVSPDQAIKQFINKDIEDIESIWNRSHYKGHYIDFHYKGFPAIL